jgi:hypothetical protein
MNPAIKPLTEITRQAFAVLTREFGPADTIRFVSQFTTGSGNYTAERDALFGQDKLADIVNAIKSAESKNPVAP